MYENQLHVHESTMSIPHFQTQSSYLFPSVLLPNVSGTRHLGNSQSLDMFNKGLKTSLFF